MSDVWMSIANAWHVLGLIMWLIELARTGC